MDRFGDGVEVALPKGDVTEGVVRVGRTVRRPRQEQSAFVAAYLGHLEAVGFRGAPRFLGVDGRGRDVLDFVEGDAPGLPPEDWACTDAVVDDIGRLLRELHDASDGWVPPPGLDWFGRHRVPAGMPPGLAALPGPPELVSHCDITPQNVVFRAGRPVAMIDFDLARPTRRAAEVLNTAMWWVPLQAPPDRAPEHRDVDVPARLTRLLDAYGPVDRAELFGLADRLWQRSWLSMRHNAQALGGGWARMWAEGVGDVIGRRRAWFAAERPALEAAALRSAP